MKTLTLDQKERIEGGDLCVAMEWCMEECATCNTQLCLETYWFYCMPWQVFIF